VILEKLVDLRDDGSFTLNQEYFNYLTGLTMTNGAFDQAVRGKARVPESPLTQREMDLARSVQVVCEEIMLRMARTVHRETGMEKSLSGGWRGAQLRGQRPAAARRAVQAALDPAGGGRTRAARWGSHSSSGTGTWGQPRKVTPCKDRCAAPTSARRSAEAIETFSPLHGRVLRAVGPRRIARSRRRSARQREDRRLVRRRMEFGPRAWGRAASSAIRAARVCRRR